CSKSFYPFSKSIVFRHPIQQYVEYMDYFAKKITNFYMTGFLTHYFMYIFLFFIFILGGTFMYLDVFAFSLQNDQPVDAFSWMLAVMIVTAGIVVLFAKSRLTAILINGFIGFLISMLFVLLRAPDLALTQLVV